MCKKFVGHCTLVARNTQQKNHSHITHGFIYYRSDLGVIENNYFRKLRVEALFDRVVSPILGCMHRFSYALYFLGRDFTSRFSADPHVPSLLFKCRK